MQGVLYPHICSTPCLSNNFVESIGVAIALTLCKQTSFLCNWCMHNNFSMILQIMESCFTPCGIFFLPSSLVVTQIRSEFITCLGALFQENLCKVTFLCIYLNLNLLIIGDVLIRWSVCGLCSTLQKNWMMSFDSNGGSKINLGVESLIPLVLCHGVMLKP